MYEAPRVEVVGSVRGMTLTGGHGGGEKCFLGKTLTSNEDWLGTFLPDGFFPEIGDCSYS